MAGQSLGSFRERVESSHQQRRLLLECIEQAGERPRLSASTDWLWNAAIAKIPHGCAASKDLIRKLDEVCGRRQELVAGRDAVAQVRHLRENVTLVGGEELRQAGQIFRRRLAVFGVSRDDRFRCLQTHLQPLEIFALRWIARGSRRCLGQQAADVIHGKLRSELSGGR